MDGSLMELAKLEDTDIYVYSGEIDRQPVTDLIGTSTGYSSPRAEYAGLFLTTLGGSAEDAYRLMRFLQRKYEHITVYVMGMCKSAGTIATLGADYIVMGDLGELGPLDVQLAKQEDPFRRTSGITLQRTMVSLAYNSAHTYNLIFDEILSRNQGLLSVQTVSEVASRLTSNLFSPVTSQITPMQLGEHERANEIALTYGQQLCEGRQTIDTSRRTTATMQLIHNYPSHGHVIDIDEAKKLFGEQVVREPNKQEELIAAQLLELLINPPVGNVYTTFHPFRKEEDNDNAEAPFLSHTETNQRSTRGSESSIQKWTETASGDDREENYDPEAQPSDDVVS